MNNVYVTIFVDSKGRVIDAKDKPRFETDSDRMPMLAGVLEKLAADGYEIDHVLEWCQTIILRKRYEFTEDEMKEEERREVIPVCIQDSYCQFQESESEGGHGMTLCSKRFKDGEPLCSRLKPSVKG